MTSQARVSGLVQCPLAGEVPRRVPTHRALLVLIDQSTRMSPAMVVGDVGVSQSVVGCMRIASNDSQMSVSYEYRC